MKRSDVYCEEDYFLRAPSFDTLVYRAVREIPRGKVATYGQIARIAGHPGAARAVGNALHRNPDSSGTPCYRVVNREGKVSDAFVFGGKNRQIELLTEQIRIMNQRHFEKKSESSLGMIEGQMTLFDSFNEAEFLVKPDAAEPEKISCNL